MRIVDSRDAVSEYFDGVAVTRGGRVLDASRGELSQPPAGGAERLLAERGRRDQLAAHAEQGAAEEAEARVAEAAAAAVGPADAKRDEAESLFRRAQRHDEVGEAGRVQLIERRREASTRVPTRSAAPRSKLDLRAERRLPSARRARAPGARARGQGPAGRNRERRSLQIAAQRAPPRADTARDAVEACRAAEAESRPAPRAT